MVNISNPTSWAPTLLAAGHLPGCATGTPSRARLLLDDVSIRLHDDHLRIVLERPSEEQLAKESAEEDVLAQQPPPVTNIGFSPTAHEQPMAWTNNSVFR